MENCRQAVWEEEPGETLGRPPSWAMQMRTSSWEGVISAPICRRLRSIPSRMAFRDRRYKEVCLTEKSSQLGDRLHPSAQVMLGQLFRDFSRQEAPHPAIAATRAPATPRAAARRVSLMR